MAIEPFQRVVITRDIPEEELCRGDVVTVVEIYRDDNGCVIGYEVELFAVDGRPLAVASVPPNAVRQPTSADRLASRIPEIHA
jgi:hypothetical protein